MTCLAIIAALVIGSPIPTEGGSLGNSEYTSNGLYNFSNDDGSDGITLDVDRLGGTSTVILRNKDNTDYANVYGQAFYQGLAGYQAGSVFGHTDTDIHVALRYAGDLAMGSHVVMWWADSINPLNSRSNMDLSIQRGGSGILACSAGDDDTICNGFQFGHGSAESTILSDGGVDGNFVITGSSGLTGGRFRAISSSAMDFTNVAGTVLGSLKLGSITISNSNYIVADSNPVALRMGADRYLGFDDGGYLLWSSSGGISNSGDNSDAGIYRSGAETLTVTAGLTGIGQLRAATNNGTTIPATCTVGETFLDTDSNDCIDTGSGDGALCMCKSTDTWALIVDL